MNAEFDLTRRTINGRFGESMRIAESHGDKYRELMSLSEGLWLSLDKRQFSNLETIMWDLHDRTKDVKHRRELQIAPERINALTAPREGLGSHIYIMNGLADIFWTSKAFRDTLPFGATLEFVKSGDYLHDHTRLAGINGVAITNADMTSHALTSRMFPRYPQKYLHDINTILGKSPMPDPKKDAFVYFMKMFDTFGKSPRRTMDDITEPGGLYDDWLKKQIETGALLVNPPPGHISAEEYARNDRNFILTAAQVVHNTVPEIPFFDALDEAIDGLHR